MSQDPYQLTNCDTKVDQEQPQEKSTAQVFSTSNYRNFEVNTAPIDKLRRCTRCVLPETMPFIEFDEDGVCNYCHSYQPQKILGADNLKLAIEPIRKSGNKPDSVVSFSGGRDSSYGLHVFVKEFGLKPIAYSYDWGMVTDLARRNQSRMCGQLGIELIIVSANIAKKRANIRKNIQAWLKQPDLGMIPLFMAGDKQYYYYANKVGKDYGLKNILMASNPLEKTFFKSGFAGVAKDKDDNSKVESISGSSLLRQTIHYAKQFITNPSYLNSSIFDTIGATLSYYMIPHNYFRLYDYIPWSEDVIERTLLDEYDWEKAPDTESTWRIGDGTAPFYNYLYYLLCGFTENDTFRSNQIREGMITRDTALALVKRDNQPRFESMKWYFDVIGMDMVDVLEQVSRISPIYQH